MLTGYTPEEQSVAADFDALVARWTKLSTEELAKRGVHDVGYLLQFRVQGDYVVPMFQFTKRPDGRVLPDLVVQNVNRILSEHRSPRQIALWWLAPHSLLTGLAGSATPVRPRQALTDMPGMLIAAALRSNDMAGSHPALAA